jgi:hypothetical protein
MLTTRATVLVAALALLVGVAACGGDDGAGGGVASLGGAAARQDDGDASGGDEGGGLGGRNGPANSAEFQDAMLAYAKCMRSHGIDLPDPTFDDEGHVKIQGRGPRVGTDGRPTDEFEAADEACRHLIEDVMPEIQLSPEERAEMEDRMLAMAECMRSKGHDMPDPQFDDKGGFAVGGPELDPDDPDVQEDLDACAEKVGMPPGARASRRRAGGGGSDDGGAVTEGRVG